MPEFDKKQYWDRRKKGLRGQVDPVYFVDTTSEEYKKHNGQGQGFKGMNRQQQRRKVRRLGGRATSATAIISTKEQDNAVRSRVLRKERGEKQRIATKKAEMARSK